MTDWSPFNHTTFVDIVTKISHYLQIRWWELKTNDHIYAQEKGFKLLCFCSFIIWVFHLTINWLGSIYASYFFFVYCTLLLSRGLSLAISFVVFPCSGSAYWDWNPKSLICNHPSIFFLLLYNPWIFNCPLNDNNM